jgi:hypothetical protein
MSEGGMGNLGMGTGGGGKADDSWLGGPLLQQPAEQSILDVLDEGRRQEHEGARRTAPLLLSALSPPPNLPASRSSSGRSVEAQKTPSSGPALSLSDDEIVALLRQRPKDVPQLHSRESFRRYFLGFPKARMLDLLRRAFSAGVPCASDDDNAEARAQRRLQLLDGVLS